MRMNIVNTVPVETVQSLGAAVAESCYSAPLHSWILLEIYDCKFHDLLYKRAALLDIAWHAVMQLTALRRCRTNNDFHFGAQFCCWLLAI